MFIPKRYGEAKVDRCPFCAKNAFVMNAQKIPVCKEHKERSLGEMRCACGSALEMRQGKFGVFFVCAMCGTMNLRKALEINPSSMPSPQKKREPEVIRSDDPRYFD